MSFASVIVTIFVLAIGTVTVVSRQKLSANAAHPKSAQDSQLSAVRQPNAHHVHYQTQDGQIVELNAEQAEKLAGGLSQLINQSTEELVEVHHADGSVSVNLDDHFQNVTVARINKNGSVAQSCVDNPVAAGAFFGIDPKLIENAPKRPTTPGRSGDR
jgi:hypothetical protein